VNVNEINRCRNSLSPKMRRKRRSNHHGMSGLKKMTMLMLSNSILNMGARTGELGKIALLSKNTTQMLGDILTSRISTEHMNRCRKLSEDHSRKALIYGEHLTTRTHKIQPTVLGKIIYK
jgi:hypothetical protein